MKIRINFPGFKQVQRTCATTETCKESSFSLFGLGYWTTCCTTDGCNLANKFNAKYLAIMGISLFSMIIVI